MWLIEKGKSQRKATHDRKEQDKTIHNPSEDKRNEPPNRNNKIDHYVILVYGSCH